MKVERYQPHCKYLGSGDYTADMMSCPNGEFVDYSDYTALKAERDALAKDALNEIDTIEAEMRRVADKLGAEGEFISGMLLAHFANQIATFNRKISNKTKAEEYASEEAHLHRAVDDGPSCPNHPLRRDKGTPR